MRSEHLGGRVVLHGGDSRDVLKGLADASIDSVVTDPPYALVSIVKRFGADGAAPPKDYGPGSGLAAYARSARGFMGKQWDTGETAFAVEFWAQVLRVLKPGGHVVAFSGTRTYHRLAVAIEDAGFEIRDTVMWLYGTGFPKSHNVGKGIDARMIAGSGRTEDMRRIAMGENYQPSGRGRVNFDHGGGSSMNGLNEPWSPRTPEAAEWQGWGTALKPAFEPIIVARKPLIGTVAENVLVYGTGAINIDGCRVPTNDSLGGGMVSKGRPKVSEGWDRPWMHDPAVTERKKVEAAQKVAEAEALGRWPANIIHDGSDEVVAAFGIYAEGSHRYFYSAKADKQDRIGSKHPTVKPVDLMQWLCRLVTPPGGTVLDPFAGSGSTGEAAWREGFKCVLIEREEEYQADIAERLRLADKGPLERKARSIKQASAAGPLFGDNDNERGGAGRSTATSPTRTHDWPDRDEPMTPEQEAAARALAASIPPTKSTPEEIAARRAARKAAKDIKNAA